ncbi:zinc transporter ZIP1-like [Glandiceps talaboti]
MELKGVKVLSLFGLFFEALICGLVPLVCVNAVRNDDPSSYTRRVISCLSCFAGGVFFATSFLHMLPEVREMLEEGLEGMGISSHFALAEFLTAIGFFIILVTEHIALMCHKRGSKSVPPSKKQENSQKTEYGICYKNDEIAPLLGNDSCHGNPSDSVHGDSQDTETSLVVSVTQDTVMERGDTSVLRSVLFLLALSLHSVFEGMAVGLQLDIQGTLELFIAIALHKGIVAFSFSLNLIQSGLSKAGMVLSLVTFAIMAPIGVAIGIIVSVSITTGPEAALLNGFLQGLATGTFIYVTFFEILPHELNVKRDEMLKVLCIIVGFAVMTVLNLFVHVH